MDSQNFARFNSLAQALTNGLQSALENQAALSRAVTELESAEAVARQKQLVLADDMDCLQSHFDAFVASAVDLGLAVNLPAPAPKAPAADPAQATDPVPTTGEVVAGAAAGETQAETETGTESSETSDPAASS